MEPIRQYSGIACPLNRVNVDTDQIIPKQFLKRIERTGFGKFLFYHWRFEDDGMAKSDFVLNQPQYREASILVTGHNFGCGSSREHAPWALLDYGFRVIIAPSFADIFYNNCVKNGILPVILQEEEVADLMQKAEQSTLLLKVNVEDQTVSYGESNTMNFNIDPYWKELLMNGWDEISVTLKHENAIKRYEQTLLR